MKYNLTRICLGENAPEQSVYAAGELRYYISLMCAKPCGQAMLSGITEA